MTRPGETAISKTFFARSTAMVTLLIMDSFPGGYSIRIDYQSRVLPVQAKSILSLAGDRRQTSAVFQPRQGRRPESFALECMRHGLTESEFSKISFGCRA